MPSPDGYFVDAGVGHALRRAVGCNPHYGAHVGSWFNVDFNQDGTPRVFRTYSWTLAYMSASLWGTFWGDPLGDPPDRWDHVAPAEAQPWDWETRSDYAAYFTTVFSKGA